MRLAILKHAQRSGAIIRQVKQRARSINKQYTKTSQVDSNKTVKTVVQEDKDQKQRRKWMHMATNSQREITGQRV